MFILYLKLEKSRKSFVNQEIHKNLGDSSIVRKTEKNIEKKAKEIAEKILAQLKEKKIKMKII